MMESERIIANTVSILSESLADCQINGPEVKIFVKERNYYADADASLLCAAPEFAPDDPAAITNPFLVVLVIATPIDRLEVSSIYSLYESLASLQHYIVIDESRIYVEHHPRLADNKWGYQAYYGLEEIIRIPSLSLELPVARIYGEG
jgi:Uma2 family endonuclease